MKRMGGMLALLLLLAEARAETEVGSGTGAERESDPCKLVSQNMSLTMLGETDYYLAESREGERVTRLYLSLCHPLQGLPSTVAELCRPGAQACLTAVQNGTEQKLWPDAGASSVAGLHLEGQHAALELLSAAKDCVNSFNETVRFKTRIDFMCGGAEENNLVKYEGLLGGCTAQVFWFSSLACLPGEREARQSGSCVLDIPGYDIKLDLASWASSTFYPARSVLQDKTHRVFQMNLCAAVTGGACSPDSPVCEVDDTAEELTGLADLAGAAPARTVTYDELEETVVLEYRAGAGERQRVRIRISCDSTALEPEITLVLEQSGLSVFRFLTARACFVPAVQCSAESEDGSLYSLEVLRGTEWEIPYPGTRSRYSIKVCGSLPMSAEYPCQAQAGVCRYDDSDSRGSPLSLGLMRSRPTVNSDGSVSLLYSGGDAVPGRDCNASAEIVFQCGRAEQGPVVEDASDGCRHSLSWRTPAACPQKPAVSHSCAVREPQYGALFNLSSLRNTTADYQIQDPVQRNLVLLNPCGPTVSSQCKEGKKGVVCLEMTELVYQEATLVMQFNSSTPCGAGTAGASLELTCHHTAAAAGPTLLRAGRCHHALQWATPLACPPHTAVQCSVSTPAGWVDLSPLSRPGENFQLAAEHGGQFVLNICRSLVHSNSSHCPYQAAACFTRTEHGQVVFDNLGQVTGGPKVSSDGSVYLQYRLGSICMDPGTPKTHMETKIFFLCGEGVWDSEPEYVELEKCHYIFKWTHAAACPVRPSIPAGNCSVTSPASGFTFDLSSLARIGGYNWSGVYHHQQASYTFNICGEVGGCGAGAGICSGNTSLGRTSSQLRLEEEQLSLQYSGGAECGVNRTRQTTIKFNCPYRRGSVASGNYERDRAGLVRHNSPCSYTVEFQTELACDHQVNCELLLGGSVLNFNKLRRHQNNYHVPNSKPGGSEFLLNICGPLVPADVPSSACNPHSGCGEDSAGRWAGLGRAGAGPRDQAGKAVLEYTGGAACTEGGEGARWGAKVVFSCARAGSAPHPLGEPRHQSSRDCVHTFVFPTLLACPTTYKDEVAAEPDSCRLFHPGLQQYIDISSLTRQAGGYTVRDPNSVDTTEYFQLQPCGRLAGCGGQICRVTAGGNDSLGQLNDFSYEAGLDSVRVRYKEGSVCDSVTGRRWESRIFYTCDPTAGPGRPTVQTVFECSVFFDWRTSLFCPGGGQGPDHAGETSDAPAPSAPAPVAGGISWGGLLLALLLILLCAGAGVLYYRPEARERMTRLVRGARAGLPVRLGGRARGDSTLLVSDSSMRAAAFGSLTQPEDFSVE